MANRFGQTYPDERDNDVWVLANHLDRLCKETGTRITVREIRDAQMKQAAGLRPPRRVRCSYLLAERIKSMRGMMELAVNSVAVVIEDGPTR